MPDDRLNMRLDPVTKHDLEQLAQWLNLSHTAAVRLALREACQQRGIAPWPGPQPTARRQEVHHKDGNPHNTDLANLELVDVEEPTDG